MSTLLDEVIAAHGGIDQWNKFDHIKAHLKVAGHIWEIKGKAGLLSDGVFEANTHKQVSGYRSLLPPYLISAWSPPRLTLKKGDNGREEVLLNPRRSFDGEKLETQWNDLQPHYFSNYAWWTYFTAPFNFTLPGYTTRQLDPWQQDGETWRRLEVSFPDYIETHNSIQVFFYGPDGLLRRHDYAPDILQSVPSSQYVSDFKTVMGLKIPFTRRIYLRNADGSFNLDPVMVSIDVLELEFSKK
jgi:hypothetical protein